MNVLFVSHCDFTGNSAMHIFSVANELSRLGVDSAVCVPHNAASVEGHGDASFQTLEYCDLVDRGVTFSNGKGPDLVHAWTPRELIRKLTDFAVTVYGCPFIVHLEDHEEVILEDEMDGIPYQQLARLPMGALDLLVAEHRSHPIRYKDFLERSAGVTALMDTLLEFKPASVPGMVFWPGFDSGFLNIGPDSAQARKKFGIAPDDVALVYTGNVHNSNIREVRSIFVAAGLLRERGYPVKLIKTGWNYADLSWVRDSGISEIVVDAGFVERRQIPTLVGMADVLVQPGSANKFNDYRFPSKLPEYLASGRPVALPSTNIGRFLKDGEQAILLKEGHSVEIADAVAQLIEDPAKRKKIGAAGRKFAVRNLAWNENAAKVKAFYDEVLRSRPATSHQIPICPDPRAARRHLETRPGLPAKLIAFYLPQYHPIPENDEWWGKGFTEWKNVVRATPAFPGHYQPHLPADLGFYDLRVPEVMDEQARLAKAYGIHGFCFYYYWFSGRRVLERPLDQMLERGKPEFPFCICWANENWTRRWDGSESEILLAQGYSDECAERFIRDVLPILKNRNYIRVNGAPMLLVYRVDQLPDAKHTADLWRRVCSQEGVPEIHLALVQSFGLADPRPFGFDSAVEFPPHTTHVLEDPSTVAGLREDFEGYLEDYRGVVREMARKNPVEYVRYRGVMPSWDNTARRGKRAHILVNDSPEIYEKWLRFVVDQTLSESSHHAPFIFINAWNEWAEGTHLEPDQKHGHRYLEATRDALFKGISDHYRRQGYEVKAPLIQQMLESLDVSRVCYTGNGHKRAASPATPSVPEAPEVLMTRNFKTSNWYGHQALQKIAARYSDYPVRPLSYGTVRDFCDSVDHLYRVATVNGDLKDHQRPWVLKAILSQVPRGGRLLEVGAGEPFVADMLSRLGYEVWVVDPYDGSGNGPREYERYSAECPNLRFIRSRFSDELEELPEGYLDCIYSISVIEHIPDPALLGVFRGMKKFIRPEGVHIHAVDHIHKGNDSLEHLLNLKKMVCRSGMPLGNLKDMLKVMSQDTETYYLSAESHNRWRGAVPYDEFPMRVCVSVQIVGTHETIDISD